MGRLVIVAVFCWSLSGAVLAQDTERAAAGTGATATATVKANDNDNVAAVGGDSAVQAAEGSDAGAAPKTDKPAAHGSSEAEQSETAGAEAAEPDPTVPPTDDPNYRLLGEFLGEIKREDGSAEPLGLQIRPIGNNRFEALTYSGGLPGAGGRSAEPMQLIGQSAGELLILSGGPWAIFAESDRCSIVDKTGQLLGELKRVARTSPTMGAKPPKGALVLFDGSNTEQFSVAAMTEDRLLTQGADVKPMFQDFNLHVEFRLPYMPAMDGQQRGNSGCYLQSRYEVQMLDSFAQLPVFNGCASLYRTKAPDINMCLPPHVWQTYDIRFTAPRWSADGTKRRNAHITVWHNGVIVQNDVNLANKTGAGKPEAPTLLPIRFQNHKDQVRFRNIWIVDRGLADPSEFPVLVAKEDVTEAIEAANDQLVPDQGAN